MKLLIIIISFNAMAISEKQAKSLFNSYLDSIVKNDEAQFKSITSKKYFSELKKGKKLQEMFKLNKGKKAKFSFDIAIKEAAETKGLYFVNIKDKKDKSYNLHWFRVIKKDGYIIDGTHVID